MDLEKLDIIPEPDPTQELDADPELLDGSNVTLQVTLPNGEEVEVAVREEQSTLIYELLLPYFIKHCEPRLY